MTTLKFEGRPAAAASEALEPWVRKLYDRPSLTLMAIVELAQTERTQPAPGSDKSPSVKVKLTHLEVPNPDQEDTVRDAQRALYLQRTASGTLHEDGQLELSEQTLRLAGGMLHALEAARLRVALQHWAHYARKVANTPDLTLTDGRKELDLIASGLLAVLDGGEADDED